jgi:hypothetical protein
MPRFVVLEHDHPELHWDLMLETGDVLRTWRLLRPPDTLGESIDAIAIGDHRKAYLDYEGPVSGGRGHVKRWDAGEYRSTASQTGLELFFEGKRLRGAARMCPDKDPAWRFRRDAESEQSPGPTARSAV